MNEASKSRAHKCDDRCKRAGLAAAHERAREHRRSATRTRLHGRRPRLRSRRHPNALGWARLRLDLIEFSLRNQLSREEFAHVRREVLRSGRLPAVQPDGSTR